MTVIFGPTTCQIDNSAPNRAIKPQDSDIVTPITSILTKTGSGNDYLPDGTKWLHEPMFMICEVIGPSPAGHFEENA